jgi:hypothetical protein
MDERILSYRFPNFSLLGYATLGVPTKSRSHFPFISKFQKTKAKVLSHIQNLKLWSFQTNFQNSLEIFIIFKCASILKYVQLNSPY